jgi:glycerol-1-phosphate dehydrogenase [NAD(P)+]
MYERDLRAQGFRRIASLPLFFRIGSGLIPGLDGILREEELRLETVVLFSGDERVEHVPELLPLPVRDRIVETVPVLSNDEEAVESALDTARRLKPEGLIGVGGGRVVDVSKLISRETDVPLLALPTNLSNDGIASPVSIIRYGSEVRSVESRVPAGVVIDLEVVRSAPRTSLLAGAGDLLSDLSAVEDGELARDLGVERIDSFALTLSKTAAERFLLYVLRNDPVSLDDPRILRHLAEGLVMSGVAMALAGTSRPSSGAEHLISHALDALLEVPRDHGIQVGVASLFALALRGSDWLLLKDAFRRLDFPTSPGELGISRETFLEAVRLAPKTRPGRFTVLDTIEDPGVFEEAYEKVY